MAIIEQQRPARTAAAKTRARGRRGLRQAARRQPARQASRRSGRDRRPDPDLGRCHTDIHAAHGDWPVKPSPPFVP